MNTGNNISDLLKKNNNCLIIIQKEFIKYKDKDLEHFTRSKVFLKNIQNGLGVCSLYIWFFK